MWIYNEVILCRYLLQCEDPSAAYRCQYMEPVLRDTATSESGTNFESKQTVSSLVNEIL
jgi:hypothetical protein